MNEFLFIVDLDFDNDSSALLIAYLTGDVGENISIPPLIWNDLLYPVNLLNSSYKNCYY